MKNKSILIVVTSLMLTSLFYACESHEKKVDDAFDIFKEAKANTKEKDTIVTIKTKVIVQNKIVVKNEGVDIWTQYKIDTEEKINESEAKIKALKAKRNLAPNKSKFDKQISQLEQNNNDLRKRMNDYNEEVKKKWGNFKVEMNHDINEIEIELKDVMINNK